MAPKAHPLGNATVPKFVNKSISILDSVKAVTLCRPPDQESKILLKNRTL